MKFKYHMPTEIFFGKDCIKKNASVFAGSGTKALVVTGRNSAKVNGSQRDIFAALDAGGLQYILFDKVENNPSIETVREGAGLACSEKVDFIIAAGGGSPLDAGKAIAVLAKNNIDDDRLFAGNLDNPVLPIIAVPTTAGTGSEVTPYSILTDKKIENKKNLAMPSIFPRYAFLDPLYTESLSRKVTTDTAVDALSHALESFLSKRSTVMSRVFARESLVILGESLRKLSSGDEVDYKLREDLLYASMLAGISIAETGTTVLHAMGYPLTYFRDVPHGMANGILMNAYIEYEYTGQKERVQEVFNAMGVTSPEEFYRLIDSLIGTDFRLSDEEIKRFVQIAGTSSSVKNTLPLPDEGDILRMYTSGTK